MRCASIALTFLLTGCGSGLLGLSSNNSGNGGNGGSNSSGILAPVAIFAGEVATNTFSDTPGSSFPPNGLTQVVGGEFADLINPSSSTQYTFTTATSDCTGTGPFEAVDFVFDVGTLNLPSISNLTIFFNSGAAGAATTLGAEPSSGNGTIEVFNANSSGNWILPSNATVGFNNGSVAADLNGPFGGWNWTPTGGPGSGQYLLVSFRSANCPAGNFSSVSLRNAQLDF